MESHSLTLDEACSFLNDITLAQAWWTHER